jgi:folylpolyglutamate synthase/dihydrofolate synthase
VKLRELADEPFFREWKTRTSGERRSLRRAQRVASSLKLDRIPFPLLTVVGSKGKATTAIYASATLASAGIRVGTLTSPPILSNRERIRIDGKAISPRDYQKISEHLSHILDTLSQDPLDGGYLSPSGLFTMMGLRYMVEAGCDAAVLEAGMGGKSDEVSLFSPLVVAVTTIFGEHMGILGNDVREIAYDKAGVIGNGTKAVLTSRQSRDVEGVIRASTEQNGCTLDLIDSGELAIAKSFTIPAGLSGLNALLGIQAGRRLLDLRAISINDFDLLETLSSVKTPGRLSIHHDRDGRTWIVDAAINESGVHAALNWVKQHLGKVDVVFVSIPAGKDVAGVRRALANQSYIPVKLDTEHLEFDKNQWGTTDLIPFEELAAHVTGELILAIGTWSFVGAVLSELGVAYEFAYST